jgi:N-methylhydantoinase A
VVTTDMGGTSFDLRIIYDSRAHFHETNSVIDRWMVNVNMVECQSIGAGGGSVGWINETSGEIWR